MLYLSYQIREGKGEKDDVGELENRELENRRIEE
jgi:hypothetical protein